MANGKPGRPTKLTPKVQKAIVDLIKAGDRPEVAAGVHGVGRRTFFDWMDRGKANPEAPEGGFRTAVLRAVDVAESDLRSRVLDGDDRGESFGRGKAALEVLSRRWPRQWAQQVKHHVETVEDEFFAALERVCADPHVLDRVRQAEDLRVVLVAVCEELARLEGEGEAPGDPLPGGREAVH